MLKTQICVTRPQCVKIVPLPNVSNTDATELSAVSHSNYLRQHFCRRIRDQQVMTSISIVKEHLNSRRYKWWSGVESRGRALCTQNRFVLKTVTYSYTEEAREEKRGGEKTSSGVSWWVSHEQLTAD